MIEHRLLHEYPELKQKKVTINILLFEKGKYDNTVIYMGDLDYKANSLKSLYVEKPYKPSSNIFG